MASLKKKKMPLFSASWDFTARLAQNKKQKSVKQKEMRKAAITKGKKSTSATQYSSLDDRANRCVLVNVNKKKKLYEN